MDRFSDLLTESGRRRDVALGIDIREPAFWKKGITFIDRLVTQAEKLARNG